jgi:dipeptidyl aminopeptidase/acylaminoacyl peptidase
MPNRRWALVPLGLAAGAAAYVGACVAVYSVLTRVPGGCRAEWEPNRPTGFAVPPPDVLDTAPWAMPEPEEVRIPSREPGVTIAGWWIPAPDRGAPAIVVVHGLTACRHDHAVLLPAGMLHRNGFSVLMIDLRDHGESTRVDGRHAGGTDEFRDVLGAWDWLRTVQAMPAARIGLLGISLGAATVLIAGGEEPEVAAVWADSSYSDVRIAIRAELERGGYPAFLEWGGVAIAAYVKGDALFEVSPLDGARKLARRAVFLTHGDADERLNVRYAYDLAAAISAEGGQVEPWIIHGAGHTAGMILQPDEYERRLARFFGDALGAPALAADRNGAVPEPAAT